MNEYEEEYKETMMHLFNQLSKLAAEHAEYLGHLNNSDGDNRSYFNKIRYVSLRLNEITRISNEITSLYNKWLGYQVAFYHKQP